MRYAWMYGIREEPKNTFPVTFARALLQYFATTPQTSIRPNEATHFYDMAGMEGPFVALFWTLGPYMYHNLIERGFSPHEAAAKIVQFEPERNSYISQLERTGQWRKSCPLGYDERMPTHLKARLQARLAVSEII